MVFVKVLHDGLNLIWSKFINAQKQKVLNELIFALNLLKSSDASWMVVIFSRWENREDKMQVVPFQ